MEVENEGLNCVEVENIIAEFPKGRLFGEIALLDPSKATRVLSAMTKSDCILLILNQEAFDIMVKEKIKRERDELGRFVYNALPNLKDHFSLLAVSSNVHVIFKENTYIKGQWITIEGEKTEKIHLIKKGSGTIYK